MLGFEDNHNLLPCIFLLQVPLVSSTDVQGGNWPDRMSAVSPPYYGNSQSPAPSLDNSPPMNIAEMQVSAESSLQNISDIL